jgi:Nucleotidyl transferase AbiEii toxin, Type IV TA system
MTETKKYTTAEAFRAALEARVKKARKANESLEVARRKIACEAFLLRIKPSGCAVILKGGFALHLRYEAGARPTKDLDASMQEQDADKLDASKIEQRMRRTLETVAAVLRDDFFSFRIGESMLDIGAGREFTGFRFAVEARIGSRLFDSFHIDMTTGDAIIFPFDQLPLGQSFAFAGLPSGEVAAIGEGQHFAEKLHAYCRDRGDKKNSRVKDLFDMAFFIQQGVTHLQVADVIDIVFRMCGNTPIPSALVPPPYFWRQPFEEMAKNNNLQALSLNEAFSVVSEFYGRILSAKK